MAKNNIKLNTLFGFILVLVFIPLSIYHFSYLETVERAVFNAGMKFYGSPKEGSKQIVLIEIDNKSLKQLGRPPLIQTRIHELLNILHKNEVKWVGIQIPFTQKHPDRALSEVRSFRQKFEAYTSIRKYPKISGWIRENIKKLELSLDHETKLAGSIQRLGNVILSIHREPEKRQKRISKTENMVIKKNTLRSRNISSSIKKDFAIKNIAIPFSELLEASYGLGYIETNFSNVSYANYHAPFILYNGAFYPSFPLRIAIAALDQKPQQVLVENNMIRLKDRMIPLTDGKIFIPRQLNGHLFKRYSFVDVLNAEKALPGLKGKVILIGFKSMKTISPQAPASFGYAGIDLSANIIEGIFKNQFISRPSFMKYLELLILIILGCVAALFFPSLKQSVRLVSALGLIILVLALSIASISFMHVWLKSVYILGCLLSIYLYTSILQIFTGERVTRESIETNRMLGLSFQSQGLLDLAFDKFRKLPLDNETKDLIYNLGLEFERKRMINKALTAYEYINKEGGFRDLDDKIPRLKESDKSSTIGSHGGMAEGSLLGDSSSQVAKNIGRYEILGELGKGAMGIVYRALDPKINRPLAIKTIRFADEFDEDVIHEIKERFFNEAEIAGQLSHPSIVTIYDVGEHEDLTYMAMEFLEGEDLEKFIIKKNLLPLRKVLEVVVRVADALDFAHKAGVIHRDIKPANVMLLNNGTVKVTDFGIAKAISSSRTKTGVILGTPNYMSPEQIMGQKIDKRSDIFSLGVLFFQLLTGETPFHGDNLSSLLYQITQVKHPSVKNYNPKIPKICEQIIDKALAKNPSQRFKSAGEMAKFIKMLVSKIDQIKMQKAVKK